MENEKYAEIYQGFKEDLKEAKMRYSIAQADMEKEEQTIASLRQSLAALAPLCGQVFEEEDEFGLTELVRMALRTLSGGSLAPSEVKARIENLGYPQKSESALAAIHTILKRLMAKGEVDTVIVQPGNKTAYRWIGK